MSTLPVARPAEIPSPSWLALYAMVWLAWRSDTKIAEKLEGFAATEAGSALDMLKAAELCEDPKLRRLFFRHAIDEARHAALFRAAARRIAPDPRRRGTEYDLIHATRQNLFARYPLVRFVAFVHVAERRGELLFRVLAARFAGRPDLADLFARIGRDERFHVAYSAHLLDRFRREGRGREVALALAAVRFTRAWEAWRRAGRMIGDLASRLMLGIVYLVVLPVFAILQRTRDPDRAGWHLPASNDLGAAACGGGPLADARGWGPLADARGSDDARGSEEARLAAARRQF